MCFGLVLFFTTAQCCIQMAGAHVKMLSLAAAASTMAFGSVAFSGVVVGGGGSCVRTEMGLQAVPIPTAACPSFAIRLGDALSVCWDFGLRAKSLAYRSRRSYSLCLCTSCL